MKAIILAAGYATRLYPLTKDQPKALLAVGEKTILGHIMDKIEQVLEIDEILIVTNNRFQKNFDSWLQTYNPKKKTHIINDGTNTNEERLGAIGDIHFVIRNQRINDDLMVIAGDNLFEFKLKDFADLYNRKDASIIALYDIKEKSKAANKYGIVAINEQKQIVSFEEKPAEPKSSLVSTACYIFTKDTITKFEEYAAQASSKDNPGDFIKWLLPKEKIYGFVFSERWFDIGSFEALEEAYEAHSQKMKINSN